MKLNDNFSSRLLTQWLQIYYRLDARYTLLTSDGYYIYVQANGLFQPGPVDNFVYHRSPESSYTQDQVEYFTHIKFEAPEGPYNWMNSIVAVGTLISHEGQVCIDCWRMTNFPGREVMSVSAIS